jgi:hypothetical protein
MPEGATEPWRMTKKEFFHPQISRKFIQAESAKDGTIIGTIGDVVHGEKTRAILSPVLDVPIMIIRTPVQEGKKIVAGDKYDFDGASGTFQGKPTIFINPNKRMVGTLWEEAAHQMRRAKGRNIRKADIRKIIDDDRAFENEYKNDPEEISAKKLSNYLGSLASKEKSHREIVMNAVEAGLPVPKNVLSEYGITENQTGQMRFMPEGDVEVKVVDRPDETTEQGTPAPDSDVQSLPLTGNPIPWDRMLSRQVRFMPESDRNAFPTMTPKLLAEIEKETPTLAAIHIDRMRVGEYMGIDLQGGMFYPTIKENLDSGVVWAFNSTGVARTVANRAAQNKGYVKLVLMQEGNVVGNKTFANIWFKILSDSVENKQISKALALTELNAARRTVYKTLEGKDIKKNPWVTKHADKWNSLEEAKEAILSMPQIERGATYFKKSKTTTKSEGEKIAYQALLSQKMAKLGFPDARKIVNDIEEPAFKGIPTGAAVAIIKFDPLGADEKIMTAKEAGVPEHMSYGYVLKGKPVAKLGYYQVVEETFPKTKGQIMTQQHTDFPIRASVPSKKSARGQIQYASAIANAAKLK